MKRVFVGMVLVIVGLILLATSNSFAQQKLPPYTIGMVTDLTGRMSDMGIANKRGMEIAVEAVNAAGGVNGRQLKVILYDGESDPSKSVIHTKKIIDVDKAIITTSYNLSGRLTTFPVQRWHRYRPLRQVKRFF